MSTAQLSHRSSVSMKRIPSRITDIPKRPQRPERTQISEIYEYDASKGSNNVVAMDMSAEMLNQYNHVVGSEESLAYKSLPPVKVSYLPTKNKFMESRGDKSSRIIRPHLTVKTHSPGHHIFTEGISKNSIVRSPTFALQKVGVPYSNLPDNISIHKEKDKFAFGVKDDEYEKSPYRLTPKPFKTGSAAFITKIEPSEHPSALFKERAHKGKSSGTRTNVSRPSLEIKSNIIKLKPLVNLDKDPKPDFGPELIKVPVVHHAPTKPPVVPRNSIHEIDTGEMRLTLKADNNPMLQTPRMVKQDYIRDRKLSVVSIGENIDADFASSPKKETRQLYPMYDHKSRLNENMKKQLFEYSGNDSNTTKPRWPSTTFTYKVSTRSMSFIQDNSPDKFKPIKNNLRDPQGNVIFKQRRHRIAASLEDVSRSNSDYNFRKYYRRVFRRPKSTDTLSTDATQIPGNPPPSEISHIFSEDGPIVINDLRNEMLTLVEERTMTASMMSPRKENSPQILSRTDHAPPNSKQGNDNDGLETVRSQRTYLEEIETCTDTDIQFENALKAVDRANTVETGMSLNVSFLETARSSKFDDGEGIHSAMKPKDLNHTAYTKNTNSDNTTDKDDSLKLLDTSNSQKQLSDQNEENSKISECENSVNESSLKNGTSVLEYIAEGEQRVKERTMSAGSERSERSEKEKVIIDVQGKIDGLDTIQEHIDIATIKTVLPKIKGSNKPLMPVPKLSLDSVENHPTLEIQKERTSLSRTLQSLNSENKQPQTTSLSENYALKLDIEKSGEVSLKKTHIPVTRLRLFSDTSSLSTNENDKIYESLGLQVNIGTTSRSTDHPQSEKKLVNNSNVSFIYPSTSEIKAKRQ